MVFFLFLSASGLHAQILPLTDTNAQNNLLQPTPLWNEAQSKLGFTASLIEELLPQLQSLQTQKPFALAEFCLTLGTDLEKSFEAVALATSYANSVGGVNPDQRDLAREALDLGVEVKSFCGLKAKSSTVLFHRGRDL